jgi:hypothetical protein
MEWMYCILVGFFRLCDCRLCDCSLGHGVLLWLSWKEEVEALGYVAVVTIVTAAELAVTVLRAAPIGKLQRNVIRSVVVISGFPAMGKSQGFFHTATRGTPSPIS